MREMTRIPEGSRGFPLHLPRVFWIAILTAMLVVAAVAINVGGNGYRQGLAIRRLRDLGADVHVDVRHLGPVSFQQWVGESRLEPFGRVRHIDLCRRKLRDEDLKDLKWLNGLEWLALNDNPITDEGTRPLGEITSLRALRIQRTLITDAGLAHLARLNRLEVLSLKQTRIKGSGLRHLTKLPRLNHLELEGTAVDDSVLADLKAIQGIRELRLDGTKISVAGTAELEREFGIRITRSEPPSWDNRPVWMNLKRK